MIKITFEQFSAEIFKQLVFHNWEGEELNNFLNAQYIVFRQREDLESVEEWIKEYSNGLSVLSNVSIRNRPSVQLQERNTNIDALEWYRSDQIPPFNEDDQSCSIYVLAMDEDRNYYIAWFDFEDTSWQSSEGLSLAVFKFVWTFLSNPSDEMLEIQFL